MIVEHSNGDGTPLPDSHEDKLGAIMLATCDGEAFLEPQIETLATQTVAKIDMWVSDDGSKDATRSIIQKVAASWTKGEVHLVNGPCQGFAENFRSLLTNPDIEADYFAFCDQDDLWD